MARFRPPQKVLDLFTTLSEGDDLQRNTAALQLTLIVKNSEDTDKDKLLQYCQERLVRGLSSGRKSARIGFSVALVRLLEEIEEIKTGNVWLMIDDKLKIKALDSRSKSEVWGIYLGMAFAISALIQANRIQQLNGNVLSSIVEMLFKFCDKKSNTKAVCYKVIQDLVHHITLEIFEKHLWSKIEGKLSEGWDHCILEKVALVLACRSRFPEVVTKKFLKKHWGYPILCESNDDKLLTVILSSFQFQKLDIVTNHILPQLLEIRNDSLTIWQSIGEKLLDTSLEMPEKTMGHREILGLKFATKLLSLTAQDETAVDIMLSPALSRYIFLRENKGSVEAVVNELCQHMFQKLKGGQIKVLRVIKKIWKLQSIMLQQEPAVKTKMLRSNNFLNFLDLISTSEAEKYSRILVDMVVGNDKWKVLSAHSGTKLKQIECCLHQLQQLSSSQSHSISKTMQASILALFLRLAFFHVNKTTENIEHCNNCINLQESDTARKLSEIYFFKTLDSIFSPLSGQPKNLQQGLEVLHQLACYKKLLLDSDDVSPMKLIGPEIQEEWSTLMTFCSKIKQLSNDVFVELNSAFYLLALFLGFYMLTDSKMAIDMLQDVYICNRKAIGEEEMQLENGDDEPHWMEVVTELLLKMMSLQSHLCRVIATIVFRLLSSNVNSSAIALITEILVSTKSSGNDESILVDADEDEGDDGFEEDSEDTSTSDDTDSEDDKNTSTSDGIISEDDEDISISNGTVSEEKTLTTNICLTSTDNKTSDYQEDESLSDLSDSEMFKMDSILAEVFRQKQKAGGKKVRNEKRQELINFKARVLDLVEVVIKRENCGDFVFDLVKPLSLMMMKSGDPGNTILAEKSKSLFMLMKSKIKVLKDTVHTREEQKLLFNEMLEMAAKVSDKKNLQVLSSVCYMLVSIDMKHSNKHVPTKPCVDLVMDALEKLISKKSSKLHVSFFSMLLEQDPIYFQELGSKLVNKLNDKSVQPHGHMICCSIIASLCTKTDSVTTETEMLHMRTWMADAAKCVTQMLYSVDKVMFYKDLLTLIVALQSRKDIISPEMFGADIKLHLLKVKSKFNTDIRRLANKVISTVDQQIKCQSESRQKKRKNEPEVNLQNKRIKLST